MSLEKTSKNSLNASEVINFQTDNTKLKIKLEFNANFLKKNILNMKVFKNQ